MRAKVFNLIMILSLTIVCWGQETAKQITWTIDNTDSIGGNTVTVWGQPKVVEKESHKAVEFNGKSDGLLVDGNPIVGSAEFTIEVAFMVYSDGPEEQRFVHFQQDQNNRILIELRLADNKWALDTFIKSGSSSHTLLDRSLGHPTDKWSHGALVYADNKMTHFVDGVEELSSAVTFSGQKGGKTSIGVRMNKVSWFYGAIRLVRVTHKALTPEQFIINEKPVSIKRIFAEKQGYAFTRAGAKLFIGEFSTGSGITPNEIQFSMDEPGIVTLKVFKPNGVNHALSRKYYTPGTHTAPINTSHLGVGRYYYMLMNQR